MKNNRFGMIAVALVTTAFAWPRAWSAEVQPRIGQTPSPAAFSLQDYRGRAYTLQDLQDAKLIVVAFLGTECPLVKLYGPRLSRLAAEFAPRGVAFVGVNSNSQDSLAEIAAYARQHAIEFPILKDPNHRLADELGARRTPEVFVLDGQRAVRYAGRIDDQYGVGYQREKPTQSDLRAALEELLAAKAVSRPLTDAPGCHIGRAPKPTSTGSVTYTRQIATILQRRCVECHRPGEIAPFSLTDYDEIVGWSDTILEVVEVGRMPPWHASEGCGPFSNERRLTSEEKQLLRTWVEEGSPQGEPGDLPSAEALKFIEGWQLPRQPDAVLTLQKEPFRVPAEGIVRYQFFRVDPGFTEDKWISAAQLLPGNRSVVHHILAFAAPPGGLREGFDELEGGRRGFLVGYVPGHIAAPLPAGMAKRIPAGSQLIFQVHYTPNGSEQFDQSKLGLIFLDEKSVTHEVRTTSAATRSLTIPPGADNHPVEASTVIREEQAQLLTLMPHMHLRGKSFRYDAILPGGKRETLLDVPRYDFNWQTAYRLAEPKPLPRGTRVECVAHFDNSERNLNNPDPTKTVRWGDQTWDEMMIGYFDLAFPRRGKDTPEGANGANGVDRGSNSRAEEALKRFDANGDGQIQQNEVPPRLLPIFQRLDADKNGELTLRELELLSRILGGTP